MARTACYGAHRPCYSAHDLLQRAADPIFQPMRARLRSSDLGFLAVADCGGRRFCGAMRLRSPGEPIAEWGCSAWEVAHGSIRAFAVHPVAVVGDGRILPFLPGPLVRRVHLDVGVQELFWALDPPALLGGPFRHYRGRSAHRETVRAPLCNLCGRCRGTRGGRFLARGVRHSWWASRG